MAMIYFSWLLGTIALVAACCKLLAARSHLPKPGSKIAAHTLCLMIDKLVLPSPRHQPLHPPPHAPATEHTSISVSSLKPPWMPSRHFYRWRICHRTTVTVASGLTLPFGCFQLPPDLLF